MKRISVIVGLCLVAVVAFSAVAAATASATPPTLLLKLSKGTFPAKFTSTGVGNITLRKSDGTTVICTKTTDTGTFENAHLGKTTITFEKCTITILGEKGPCNTEKSETGERIVLSESVTHFGSILKEKGVEGSAVPGALILLPSGKFVFECFKIPLLGKITVTVTGEGVAGLVQTTANATPVVGTEYASLNLNYEESSSEGTQKYTEFLLPLESNKLMSGLQLELENTGTKTKEKSAQVSSDTLEKFENAAKEAVEVSIEEG